MCSIIFPLGELCNFPCLDFSWSQSLREDIGYITDIEGDIDTFNRYVDSNGSVLRRENGVLTLKDEGAAFVFGGDIFDRGPGDLRLARELVNLKKKLCSDQGSKLGQKLGMFEAAPGHYTRPSQTSKLKSFCTKEISNSRVPHHGQPGYQQNALSSRALGQSDERRRGQSLPSMVGSKSSHLKEVLVFERCHFGNSRHGSAMSKW